MLSGVLFSVEEASVFDEVFGVPAHPLIVHAAVVFVPLLCALAVAYAVLPRFRAQVGWLAALLAVGAPIAAWFGTLSGEALVERLYQQEVPPSVVAHEEFGDATLYASLPLGLVTLALVFLTGTRAGQARRLPPWIGLALSGLTVVLAAVAAYYVVRTGHSGATAVWGS